MIQIDVNIGDTILTGKFKNKPIIVKTIGKDERGMPTINGKKVVTFRIKNKTGENKMKVKEDLIPGGKGDNTNQTTLDQNEFKVGIAVEREHTNSDEEATEIATDHLTENPKYYSELIKAGLVDEKYALELAKQLGLHTEGLKKRKSPTVYKLKNGKTIKFIKSNGSFVYYKDDNGKEQHVSTSEFNKMIANENIVENKFKKLVRKEIKNILKEVSYSDVFKLKNQFEQFSAEEAEEFIKQLAIFYRDNANDSLGNMNAKGIAKDLTNAYLKIKNRTGN